MGRRWCLIVRNLGTKGDVLIANEGEGDIKMTWINCHIHTHTNKALLLIYLCVIVIELHLPSTRNGTMNMYSLWSYKKTSKSSVWLFFFHICKSQHSQSATVIVLVPRDLCSFSPPFLLCLGCIPAHSHCPWGSYRTMEPLLCSNLLSTSHPHLPVFNAFCCGLVS